MKKRNHSVTLENENRSPSPSSDEISSGENTFLSRASRWNLEQDYETRPRKNRKLDFENGRLPIKTAEGLIQHVPSINKSKDEESRVDCSSSEYSEPDNEKSPSKSVISTEQQILEAKEELAKTALLLRDNDPEENVGAFKTLAQLGQTSNLTIKKLALVTQLAVFKDIIPGYRIRPLSNDDKAVKVSKEVKKLRAYEQELVTGYQRYVRELSYHTGSVRKKEQNKKQSLHSIAISCACTLLTSVPHFNFRGDLIKIIVGKLSSRKIDPDFVRCRETVQKLFEEDEDGLPSLEVVNSLSKMMKEKGYRVDESVINLFLYLRLLSEFSSKGSLNHIDKNIQQEYGNKKPREKKVFRTKKERKLMRERKSVEQELKAADAIVSNQEKDRMQAETLKRVFVTYFRILKLRSSNLMGAVLEGLARYAHLINQDFFGDLIEALKDLFSYTTLKSDPAENDIEYEDEGQNITREALLCIITAFTLLEGQDVAKSKATLNLDLSFFTTHLYRTLHALSLDPNIELCRKSLHISEPTDGFPSSKILSKINFETTTVLLLRSISSILTPPLAARAVPPIRIAAFTKQLLTSCLQLPEKSCIAMITLLGKVVKLHGKKIASLWNTEERRGDGVFDPLSFEVEGSNPFATTVWEGELLKKHFSPTVRDWVKIMEKNVMELGKS